MAKAFVTPFALSGDKAEIPTAIQPDGSVSYGQGFGPDYQAQQGTPGAKDIPRDQFNQLMHDITEAIGFMQRHGFAEYDPAMAPYPQGATVRSGSTNYISSAGNNSTVPGAAGASWVILGGDTTPVGTTIMFNAESAPPGYLIENGAAVSRTQYAALFSVIGTRFGAGNGSTTFNLPNSGGEFPRFAYPGQTVDSGRVVGSKQGDAFRSHFHPTDFRVPPGAGNFGSEAEASKYQRAPAHPTQDRQDYSGPAMSQASTDVSGSNETRPRNIAKLPCIKF